MKNLKRHTNKILLTLGVMSSLTAKGSSYVRKWNDLDDANLGLELERTYNSQSLVNGSFGFGWCSELETTLEPTRDGRLKLHSCTTQNSETVFYPRSSNPTPRPKGDRSPAFSPAVGASFTANDSERVEIENGIYVQYRNGTPLRKFDQTGRLLEWRANGVVHRVKRNVDGNPVFWSTSKGARVAIQTDPRTGYITAIQVPGKGIFKYQYNGQNLVFAQAPNGVEWNYLYDDLHNLTRTASSDGVVEKVQYDKLHDEVISVQKDIASKEIR